MDINLVFLYGELWKAVLQRQLITADADCTFARCGGLLYSLVHNFEHGILC